MTRASRPIVVIEDNATFLALARRFIDTGGRGDFHVAGTAASIAEGLQLCRDVDPALVIVDLALPDGTGLSLVRLLRERSRAPAIVVLTLYDAESYRRASLDAGADGFVGKSQMAQELLPEIRRCLAGAARAAGRPRGRGGAPSAPP